VQSPLQPVTSYMPQGPLHQQYYGGTAVLPPLQGQMSAYGIPQQQGQYMAASGVLQPAPTYQPSYVGAPNLQQQMQGLRVAGGAPQYPPGQHPGAAAAGAGVYHHHPAMQQQALAMASATAASAAGAGAGRQGGPGGLQPTAAAGGGGEGVAGPVPHRDVFSSSSSAWQIDPAEIALGPRIGIGSYGEVGAMTGVTGAWPFLLLQPRPHLSPSPPFSCTPPHGGAPVGVAAACRGTNMTLCDQGNTAHHPPPPCFSPGPTLSTSSRLPPPALLYQHRCCVHALPRRLLSPSPFPGVQGHVARDRGGSEAHPRDGHDTAAAG
jgi:hypothetical protein